MEELFSYERQTVTKTNDKLRPKTAKSISLGVLKTSKRNEAFKDIIDEAGGLPKNGNFVAIKTNGTSDVGNIFDYILSQFDAATEMYLATWTISKANISRLNQSISNGKVKHLCMVFSSTLKPANPALYASLMSSLKPHSNVELKEINSHAKTFSITDGVNYYTVTGSANWSENPRIENFLILNSKELFNHHKEWMTELTRLV
jgi:hypothetical protein